MVFVFGSNLAGVHGAGAATEARRRGYPHGLGVGPGAYCYAIPTKDCQLDVLPLAVIELYVKQFVAYSRMMHDIKFQVTRVGCGLAGYKDDEVAPLFHQCGDNCAFDTKWRPYLIMAQNWWGTYP